MAVDTANALCSLANVKVFAGITSTDTTYDTRLEKCIDAASMYHNKMTDYDLLARTVTEYQDGDGTDKVILHERPVSGVTLYSDPDRAWATAVTSTYYEVWTNEGILIMTQTSLDVGDMVLKITYTGGYSTIPADLELSAITLAIYWYEQFRAHRIGLTTASNEAGSVAYVGSIPEYCQDVIKRYRRKSYV